MAIVWIDIWDVQSGQNAKILINRCFNVGNYIATIRGANMNPGVPQCKNCWKWGHSTFSCRIQGAKCVKCNGPHKSEHHREFSWCCKSNAKINPPVMEHFDTNIFLSLLSIFFDFIFLFFEFLFIFPFSDDEEAHDITVT